MTLDFLLRSRRTVYKHIKSVAESSLQVNPRAAGTDESTPLNAVLFARRSINSHTRRNIILGSVLGAVGFIALVLCGFLILRYYNRHREVSQESAMAASMVIEDPSQLYHESRQKPTVEPVPPPPPPKPTYIPERILNHPYASPYSRNVQLPSPAPSQPLTASRSVSRRTPAPLNTTSHPYSPRRNDPPPPQPSADPSNITYESFMSPLAPTPIPGPELSPIASTAGGVDSLTQNRETMFSNHTTDTAASRSSSTPLQPRNHRPHRR